jgi:bifunctional UDP-N-acetylglucosamine pyrophosphorylase/glucosamine-1-phosphate N-acetyltransferase
MKGYSGNKTILPLIPGSSRFEGSHPILLHILNNLPSGPKALIVNHRKEDLINVTQSFNLSYHIQPELNGTGGALIAGKEFLINHEYDQLIITYGDVPFVRPSTYKNLLKTLDDNNMSVLGFRPVDKKKYGVLEVLDNSVRKIIEWEYWGKYPMERQKNLDICNSGVYAVRKNDLIRHLDILENHPHIVLKEREGKKVEVKEFFITDLVELMQKDNLDIGYIVAEDEDEVMGIDDLQSLVKAQDKYNAYI